MGVSFFKAADLDRNIKCTIHKSGKLGFTDSAIKKLNIEVNRYIKLGKGDDEKDSTDLYMAVQPNEDEFSFKASKAGVYYYINTKVLFDMLNIDYKKNTIIYDIIKIEEEGKTMYKLKRREKERK
jgi:hypothetical protein